MKINWKQQNSRKTKEITIVDSLDFSKSAFFTYTPSLQRHLSSSSIVYIVGTAAFNLLHTFRRI